MRQALIDLGYRDCYHFAAMMNENQRDAEMWMEAFDAKFEGKGKPFTREDWDQLLGHCMAVTDTPCAVFYKELLEAYPEAKVILTLRDSPEQWWQSQMRTIMPFFKKFSLEPETWSNWLYRKFLPPQTAFDRLNNMLPQKYVMYRLLVEDARNGTKKTQQWYEDYAAEIRRIVPKDRLLVMNVKQGWEPLCRFLDKNVPDWEFPGVNAMPEWDKNIGAMYQMIDRMVYWNAFKTIAPVLVGAAAIGTFWLWQRQ